MSDQNALVAIESLTPVAIFVDDGGVDAVIRRVQAEVDAFKPDVSTPAGREAIRSFAFKIAKTKTGIEALGKELVAETKQRVKKIDAERARLWDRLEDLQKAARKPLDDFEAKEATRVAAHEAKLAEIAAAVGFESSEPSASIIAARIAIVEQWRAEGRDWQEFQARAELAFADTMRSLNSKLTAQTQREAERAELEAFRAAEAERIKKENEDRIAREAADAARKEAEDKAAREAEEAARVAAAEIAKAREREEAAAREATAAAERAATAERERLAAEQRARDAAAKAVADEKARVAAQKKADDDAAAARAKDKANRDAKNAAAAKAIDAIVGPKIPYGDLIVRAIADGKIPNVTISY
jgi:hypothetical protein